MDSPALLKSSMVEPSSPGSPVGRPMESSGLASIPGVVTASWLERVKGLPFYAVCGQLYFCARTVQSWTKPMGATEGSLEGLPMRLSLDEM